MKPEFNAWDKQEKKMYTHVEDTADGDGIYPAHCFGEMLQSSRFVVLQFTGKLVNAPKDDFADKHKIFAGDLIAYKNPKTKATALFEVIWNENKSAWGLKTLKSSSKRPDEIAGLRNIDTHPERFTHAGNRYENPELLNGA